MFLVQCFCSGGVVERIVTACRELLFALAVKCRGLDLIQGFETKEMTKELLAPKVKY